MKRLLHIAMGVFLFVLVGCQKTENQIVNVPASPTPETRLTENKNPAPPTTPTPTAREKYMSAFNGTLDKATTSNELPSNPTLADIVDARTTVEQASEEFASTPVPPEFKKLDTLAKEALNEEIAGLHSWESSIKTDNKQALEDASKHIQNASELIRKAKAEMLRIKGAD